jgi:prepilin-type N-terminal cleavage/methylation domain-containing protein
MTPRPTTSRAARSAGFTLVELLIGLAICAVLMVATAMAIDGTFRAYRFNQEEASLIHSARMAEYRMLSMVRTTREHQPVTAALATQFAAGQVVTDVGLTMLQTDGTEVTFRYDAATHKLLAETGGQSHTMVEGVTQFQVILEPMRSATSIKTGGGWDLLKRATILISVRTTSATATSSETTGQQVLTLSSSVMPRQNTW